MSDSLQPHGLKHARPPYLSSTTGVYPNSCPLSQWCHPSNHLILCHPLLLLPSMFPSIRVFSKKSALCIRWPKYWSFSFNISPSNEHPGLISFVVPGNLKRLFQHQLDSSLCFIQSSISHDGNAAYKLNGNAYKLNKQGDNIQPWCTPSQFETSPC